MTERKVSQLPVDEMTGGSEPCSPERIQPGDVVVGLLRLGTRLAVRYIFENKTPPPGEDFSRDVKNVQVFTSVPQNAGNDERRDLCNEAFDDLEARFADVLDDRALNILRIFIGSAVLAKDDPTRPPDLSKVDPDIVNTDLMAFLVMELGRFDFLGRLKQ